MLYDMADTNFVLYREKVVTPESKHKIVKEASKPSMVMACILVFILILVILGWTCPPLILKYSDNSVQEDIPGISEEMSKYYSYILWHPKEISNPSA